MAKGKRGNYELRISIQNPEGEEISSPREARTGPKGIFQEYEVAVTSKSSEVKNSPKNTIYFLSAKCVSGPVLGAEDIVFSNRA